MKNFLSTSKLGLRAQEEGKFSLAYNLLGKAINFNGLSERAMVRLEARRAECLLGTGNFRACEEHLSYMEAQFGHRADCLAELAHFYYRLDEFSLALDYYQRALKLAPNWLRLYDFIARLYIDINRYPDAIQYLEQGIQIEKPSPKSQISKAYLHVQLALCFFYIEELEKSRENFQAAEKTDDTKIYDWDIYGRCLLRLGDYHKAVVCFDRSLLEICAEDYEVYLYKAKALIALGRLEEAKGLIRSAKHEIGELLIFPSDLRYYAPLIANGFMSDMGAILVEE